MKIPRTIARFLVATILCVSTMSQEKWVQPHFFTGEELLRACETTRETDEGISSSVCLGYIAGVVDTSTGTEIHAVREDGTTVLPLCLPESMNSPAIVRAVVVKYMKDHPTGLKMPAVYLVHSALSSYGCKTGWPDGIRPPTHRRE